MAADPVTQFEQTFAQWLGAERAFAFWKGRVALYAILKALGIGEGDEVILPGYTCVVVANPVKFLRARPVYVDIEPDTYNIDPSLVGAKIAPRTRAIIAQHTYGYPARMDAILDVAKRRGLPVIEDACLAVGSALRGKKAGTFGLAAYWSFQWNKTFTTGIGGLVTTSDRELAAKIENLRAAEVCRPGSREALMLAAQRMVHRAVVFPKTILTIQAVFRWMTAHGMVVGSSSRAEYELVAEPDFFKGMSAGQARAAVRQMHRLGANLAHRRQMADLYHRLLRERGWPMPSIPGDLDPVLVRYPVRVADKPKALALAAKRRVELGDWFHSPLHQAVLPLEMYDYRAGMCPEAEKAAREVVNLPTHPRAGERHALRAVELLSEIGPAP